MIFSSYVKTHEANVFGRPDTSLCLIRHRLLLAELGQFRQAKTDPTQGVPLTFRDSRYG
ncbi:hypothetical protein EMIT0P43_40547 [Pseudomonas jessenii]